MIPLIRPDEPNLKRDSRDKITCKERRSSAHYHLLRYYTAHINQMSFAARKRYSLPTTKFTNYSFDCEKEVLFGSSFGKCAYCEARLDPASRDAQCDHYFPKSTYFWLTHEWKNFLPLCINCNGNKGNILPYNRHKILLYRHHFCSRYKTQKKAKYKAKYKAKNNFRYGCYKTFQKRLRNRFPAFEHLFFRLQPQLINPYEHNPQDHFYFEVDDYSCRLIERSPLGRETINLLFRDNQPACYNLKKSYYNSVQNVKNDVQKHLTDLMEHFDLNRKPDFREIDRLLLKIRNFQAKEHPFSALYSAYIQYYWNTPSTKIKFYESRLAFAQALSDYANKFR